MTGTLTLTNFPFRDRLNDRLVREVQYTGPSAYVAGGDPISGNDLGSGEIYGVYGSLSNGTNVLSCWWNYATQKLKIFAVGQAAEASGDLSAYTGTLLFHVKG